MDTTMTQPMRAPSAPDILANSMLARALEHAKHGRHERAWEIARVVVSMRPERACAWMLIGEGARRAGRWGTALEAFERAHRVAPGDEEAAVAYGEILWQVGKARQARAVLRGVMERGVREGVAAADHPAPVIRAGALLEALVVMARRASRGSDEGTMRRSA